MTTTCSDARPADDILWPEPDYRAEYRETCHEAERLAHPLATGDEGVDWISATTVALGGGDLGAATCIVTSR